MKSHFINRLGFDDRERKVKYAFDHCFPTTLYHVRASEYKPVTWIDSAGDAWTFNKSFWSDRGSIPNFLHCLCEPDTFLIPFYFHDSACRFKGLHKNGVFHPLTRLECDAMLRQWVLDSDGTTWQAEGIYRGVRLGAALGIGGNWGAGDLRKQLQK